jgi:nitroreductase
MAEAELFDIIYSMRAMRRLKPDPIPEATLKKIIDAGIHAPSGGNAQGWAFVLVRDADAKRFIRDHYYGMWQQFATLRKPLATLTPAQVRQYHAADHLAEHLHEVPVLLLACVRKGYPPFDKFGYERASVATVHGSIYPAVQNIMLACRALGIGTVLTTVHYCFEEELKQHFGIPTEMEVSALLPLGYPQGNFGPTKRKPVETVIHWDRWQKKT